jgi:hypothetical protein
MLFRGKIANTVSQAFSLQHGPSGSLISAVKGAQFARLPCRSLAQCSGRLIGKLRVGAAAEVVIIRSSVNFVFIG